MGYGRLLGLWAMRGSTVQAVDPISIPPSVTIFTHFVALVGRV